ncbi:EF-hand domain-containing protein [Maribacter stanieri]|uniref:EF-hand domain-containing protein n=1 Tax=Maribacter stanieri TaxID=440514 RepID=UPI002493FAC3|nr:EF-hand domain-containing protein [Maribacter stanieri]|tara:strand:+ start:1331 stop:1612 length:282 start_codon:yes stop_codon:yes gene_type:complete
MKRITLKTGLLFAMLVAFGTVTANAQSKGERKEPPTATELLKQMDKDEDGQLSKDEVKGPLKDDFDKIDADEDGFLSKEEIENAPKPKGRPRN